MGSRLRRKCELLIALSPPTGAKTRTGDQGIKHLAVPNLVASGLHALGFLADRTHNPTLHIELSIESSTVKPRIKSILGAIDLLGDHNVF